MMRSGDASPPCAPDNGRAIAVAADRHVEVHQLVDLVGLTSQIGTPDAQHGAGEAEIDRVVGADHADVDGALEEIRFSLSNRSMSSSTLKPAIQARMSSVRPAGISAPRRPGENGGVHARARSLAHRTP